MYDQIKKTEGMYKKIREGLGDNYNTILSSGDYIYLGILPYRGSYSIYAGNPEDENNMIYPDWNYSKVKKREVFNS